MLTVLIGKTECSGKTSVTANLCLGCPVHCKDMVFKEVLEVEWKY